MGAFPNAGRFPLYRFTRDSNYWQPVDVPAGFEAKAIGEAEGSTLVGGRSLLVASPSGWIEKSWPAGFVLERLAGHPKARWVAAWGAGNLVVGPIDGALTICRLDKFAVAWAAWDPFRTDSIVVTDAAGNAARLSLPSVKPW